MTLTAPTGPISRAESLLATSLAACARWRQIAGGEDEALQRIYFDALPPPPGRRESYRLDELQKLRPFVIVYSDEDTSLTLVHRSTGSQRRHYHDSGALKFYVERDVLPEIALHPSEVDRRMKNDCGALMEELLALSGQAGYLAIVELSGSGPMRSHPDELPTRGDYQQFHFTARWGRQ